MQEGGILHDDLAGLEAVVPSRCLSLPPSSVIAKILYNQHAFSSDVSIASNRQKSQFAAWG